MYVVCIKNKKSLKRDFLFLYGGVLQMIDYYQMFLITMAGIALFFIYNMLENQRKETNGSF